LLEIKNTYIFALFYLKTDNSPFCHRGIPTLHNGYDVSNAVDYAKKNDGSPTICQLNKWVSTCNNRFLHRTQLNQYLPLILLVFIFLLFEHLEDSCFKSRITACLVIRCNLFKYEVFFAPSLKLNIQKQPGQKLFLHHKWKAVIYKMI